MSLVSPALRLFSALLLTSACALNTFGPGSADSSTRDGETSTGTAEDPTTGSSTTGSSTTGSATTGGEGVCGDGEMDGVEECDDGDDDDDDACTNACKLAVCGDGVLGPGEACDDGDKDEHDACTNACKPAVCGDGVLGPGEACDDGMESLECNGDCTFTECGDGKINEAAGEACDDENEAGGDACSPEMCQPTIVAEVVTGLRHVCVRFTSGAVRCWGNGLSGRLGGGGDADLGDDEELPVADIVAGDEIVQLCAGGEHTCAREATGGARCWGSGQNGRLGYGDMFDLGDGRGEMPTPLLELGGPISELACGGILTCARTLDDTVHCWGIPFAYGDAKARGDEPNELPTPAVPGLLDVAQISLGDTFGCVRTGDGQVFCWGDNDDGQLGQESQDVIVGDAPGELPAPPTELGGAATQIAAGRGHVCAIVEGGKVRCWGDNGFGQLGYGDTIDVGREVGDMPSKLVDIGGTAEQIVAGSSHTCVLSTTGKVRCWGAGNYGQLGNMDVGTIGDEPGEMPPDPVELGGDAVALSSHLGSFTCALLVDGTLRCWGSNQYGQLGYGNEEPVGDDETPAMAGPVPF